MRPQITLRLSREELDRLDAAAARLHLDRAALIRAAALGAAAARLHLDRAALIRAAALGAAEVVLESTRPLVLAVEPSALLRRVADQLAGRAPGARARGAGTRRKR